MLDWAQQTVRCMEQGRKGELTASMHKLFRRVRKPAGGKDTSSTVGMLAGLREVEDRRDLLRHHVRQCAVIQCCVVWSLHGKNTIIDPMGMQACNCRRSEYFVRIQPTV